MESLGVIALFISLILLFIFIKFIKNTRDKILKLTEELQDYSTQLENSINKVVKNINDSNEIISTKFNEIGSGTKFNESGIA